MRDLSLPGPKHDHEGPASIVPRSSMNVLTEGKGVFRASFSYFNTCDECRRRQKRSLRWQRVRILKSIQTKVCVDGSLMKEDALDEPLTEGFLKFLEKFGTVRSLEQLKKPYSHSKKSSSSPSRDLSVIAMSRCDTKKSSRT